MPNEAVSKCWWRGGWENVLLLSEACIYLALWLTLSNRIQGNNSGGMASQQVLMEIPLSRCSNVPNQNIGGATIAQTLTPHSASVIDLHMDPAEEKMRT